MRRQSLNAPEGIVTVDEETQHTWRPVFVGRIRSDGQFDIVWSSEKADSADPVSEIAIARGVGCISRKSAPKLGRLGESRTARGHREVAQRFRVGLPYRGDTFHDQ